MRCGFYVGWFVEIIDRFLEKYACYYYLPKKQSRIDDEYWTVGNKYYIRASGYHWHQKPNNHNFGYWVTCDEYNGDDKDYCVFIWKKDFVKDFKVY